MKETFYWVQIDPEKLTNDEFLDYVEKAIPQRHSEATELLQNADDQSRKRTIQLITQSVQTYHTSYDKYDEMVRTSKTIPALLLKNECEKYGAFYGKDNEYVANYGITCRDEETQTGITLNWFAPSISVKKSTDALRSLIQSGSFYVPTESDEGKVDLSVKVDGINSNGSPKYIVEKFDLEHGQWKLRALELLGFKDPERKCDKSEEASHSSSSEERCQSNKAVAISSIYPTLTVPNQCSTPGPLQKGQAVRASKGFDLQIPVGSSVLFETGHQTDNIVEIKGTSDWKEGEITYEVRGPLGQKGKWYPEEIRTKEKVDVRSYESGESSSDEKNPDDSLIDLYDDLNRSNFIDDSYHANGLGMSRKTKVGRPKKALKPDTRRNISTVQEESENQFGDEGPACNTRNRKSKKVNVTRRSQRAREVIENTPVFVCSKPSPHDDLWSFVYRVASDYADHRVFYRLTPEEVDVPSVTRIMLKYMINFGLVSNQMRGLRNAASTSTSFQNFITNIIRLSGTIGSITTELNQLKFDPDDDNIYAFLFKIFAFMRLVYDYDNNDQIPKEKIFYHVSLSFSNCIQLRRFYTEVIKYQLLESANFHLDQMADMLRSFLDDQSVFQKSSTKKRNVNLVESFVRKNAKNKSGAISGLKFTNEVYGSEVESDGDHINSKQKTGKTGRSKSGVQSQSSMNSKVEKGSTRSDRDYLFEALERMNVQLSSQKHLFNELKARSEANGN